MPGTLWLILVVDQGKDLKSEGSLGGYSLVTLWFTLWPPCGVNLCWLRMVCGPESMVIFLDGMGVKRTSLLFKWNYFDHLSRFHDCLFTFLGWTCQIPSYVPSALVKHSVAHCWNDQSVTIQHIQYIHSLILCHSTELPFHFHQRSREIASQMRFRMVGPSSNDYDGLAAHDSAGLINTWNVVLMTVDFGSMRSRVKSQKSII